MFLTKSRNTWPALWWCSDCRNRVSKIAYLFCNMTNECFAILVSAPDFIEEGPLLHCTHCTKKLKKASYSDKLKYWGWGFFCNFLRSWENELCHSIWWVFCIFFYFHGFSFSNTKSFNFVMEFLWEAGIFSLMMYEPEIVVRPSLLGKQFYGTETVICGHFFYIFIGKTMFEIVASALKSCTKSPFFPWFLFVCFFLKIDWILTINCVLIYCHHVDVFFTLNECYQSRKNWKNLS